MVSRKIISLLLVFILLSAPLTVCSAPYVPEEKPDTYEAFAYSPPLAVFTSSSNTNQLNQILSYGRSLIGSTAYNGLCQRFVRLCYESSGIYAKQAAFSALEAWGLWGVSTSKDNIPLGACVYFQGYGYDWTYGHVAIYIGNGYVLDATYNYGVSERYVTNWTGYLGWGYQAGVAPTGSSIENTTQAPSTTAPSTTIPSTTTPSTSHAPSEEEGSFEDGESSKMIFDSLINFLQKLISVIGLYLRNESI